MHTYLYELLCIRGPNPTNLWLQSEVGEDPHVFLLTASAIVAK